MQKKQQTGSKTSKARKLGNSNTKDEKKKSRQGDRKARIKIVNANPHVGMPCEMVTHEPDNSKPPNAGTLWQGGYR